MRHDEPAGPRVLSGDARLLDALRTADGTGCVHSVFTRVINLLTWQGTLIALASPEAGDAPRTLVVDVADWTRYGPVAGRSVAFAPGTLTLPGPGRPLRLKTSGARPWYPETPSLAHLGPGGFAAAAAALDRLVRAHGTRGGMLGAHADAGPMERAVVQALHAGRSTLTAAILDGDESGMHRGVLALLGLGPGLTPAGDDFLAGLALVAALPGSALTGFGPVLRRALVAHPARTTDLSRATLAEAAEGRVRGELIDVLRQLAPGPPPWELHAPVRRALAVGHTSGSDTLSGLSAGLHLEEELRGSL
ncbi:DUF2877 domain-containing protein [Streptomyces sp. NPDC050085]|uniref:oxamate carbamoyltransferase subunit AllH family protein n=1 Tax=Streptomyces sp. NPDC050085 TaxID=3365600 RepID=UPI0037A1C4CA